MEESFLDAVEQDLGNALSFNSQIVPFSRDILLSATTHLCLGTKAGRARPLLTLFFGQCMELHEALLIQAATAIELIHSASLLHDDVIDDGHMRRGKNTVNVQYGNTIAVLSGNFLLSAAFDLLKTYPHQATTAAIQVVAHMTKAAIAEVQIRGSLDVSIPLWNEIALGKTGTLFGLCGELAALANHQQGLIPNLQACGQHIGIVFQMADDLKDFWKTKSLKDRFSDLKNKEPSLPIVLASQRCPSLCKEIALLWQQETPFPEQIQQVGEAIVHQGILEQVSLMMYQEIEQVTQTLTHLSHTKGAQKIQEWLHKLYKESTIEEQL